MIIAASPSEPVRLRIFLFFLFFVFFMVGLRA